jgi:Protein of unknown function (Hypoth_ymh)
MSPAMASSGEARSVRSTWMICAATSPGVAYKLRANFVIMDETSTGWFGLPESLVNTSKEIAGVGKYDEAIFAAFKFVEAEIQARIGSANIGKQLITEAFAGATPRIEIGKAADRDAIFMLFAGSLGHIRNDRGHGQAPAVPCTNLSACISYLHFAALLLYLLSKDNALRPRVDGISIRAIAGASTVELYGANLTQSIEVRAGSSSLAIVQQSAGSVQARLPADFIGEIALIYGDEVIYTEHCDARAPGTPHQLYEVIAADLPLFSDSQATTVIAGAVGALVKAQEAHLSYPRISPTVADRYKAGDFLTNGSWDPQRSVAEAWYRDPINGAIRQAWNWSMIWNPQIVGDQSSPKLSRLDATPGSVSVEPGGIRTILATGRYLIGDIPRDVDLTHKAKWGSTDESVAHVKAGIVRAKRFGATTLHCEAEGFRSDVIINVEQGIQGNSVAFLDGLGGPCQLVFDGAGSLFITNQSHSIHRLDKDGGLTIGVQAPNPENYPHGFDYIALDDSGALYLTSPEPRRVLVFARKGNGFDIGRPVADGDRRPRRSVAISSKGEIVVGLMGLTPGVGAILVVGADGSSREFPTRDSAHNLAIGPDDRIFVTANPRAIDVYDISGTYIESIEHSIPDGVGAIAVGVDGTLYVGGFHSGQVEALAIDRGICSRRFVAESLGTITGLALGPDKNLYSSDVSAGRIWLTYL